MFFHFLKKFNKELMLGKHITLKRPQSKLVSDTCRSHLTKWVEMKTKKLASGLVIILGQPYRTFYTVHTVEHTLKKNKVRFGILFTDIVTILNTGGMRK